MAKYSLSVSSYIDIAGVAPGLQRGVQDSRHVHENFRVRSTDMGSPPPPFMNSYWRTGSTEYSESRHLALDSRSTPPGSIYPATDRSPREDPDSQRPLRNRNSDEDQNYSTQLTVVHLASRFLAKGSIVPQKLYCPPVDQTRRMGRAQLNPPIMFFLTSPDYCGIPCQDALHLRVRRLRDRDEPAFSNGGSKTISLRFMWSGYPPYSRQIPIHDFRAPPQPITVASLARNVARTVKRFLQDMAARPMQTHVDRKFRIGGRDGITIDDLEIVGLQHVSMSSWQVHLRLIKGC